MILHNKKKLEEKTYISVIAQIRKNTDPSGGIYMFAGLRKNAKIVIYIIAGVFILSIGFGGITSILSPEPFLAKIDGKKISYTEYSERLQGAWRNYLEQNPDQEIDDKAFDTIKNETWTNLVAVELYNKALKRRKIIISEDDIIDALNSFRLKVFLISINIKLLFSKTSPLLIGWKPGSDPVCLMINCLIPLKPIPWSQKRC